LWILLEQEMMGWQWLQLDHMQIICTSLQTDNHASTSPLSFYRPDAIRWYFDFELPSELLAKKRAKFERKFTDHKDLHRYFGICVI